MHLKGIGTAVPPRRFTQAECWSALEPTTQFRSLNSRSQALLRKVLTNGHSGGTRHLAVSDLSEMFSLTPDSLHARFAFSAPELATHAARRALEHARLLPSQVDAVLISTCTGYLCPGLTSYVTERLGLRADVQAIDLVGQGCGAALPNCRLAEALLASRGAKHVLSVCVEVCSAAFYLDDDPGVLISACLFADGAAAVVWSGEPADHFRRVEWKTAESFTSPADRDFLRFQQRDGMLRNILTREVPELAAKHAARLFDKMAARQQLQKSEVTGWVLHAGGREVLAAMQAGLAVRESDLRVSAALLQELGNVSSPFVLFALERAIAEQSPGGWWWMASFGAGFSCHGAFLHVE